ncbi:MAG: hypothetical protein WCP19_12420, partial [Chloroflexota bacterium]
MDGIFVLYLSYQLIYRSALHSWIGTSEINVRILEVRMLEKLNTIEKEALDTLAAVSSEAELEAWRVANIGRSSAVMNVFSQMGGLSKEERPLVGQRANQVKLALEDGDLESVVRI